MTQFFFNGRSHDPDSHAATTITPNHFLLIGEPNSSVKEEEDDVKGVAPPTNRRPGSVPSHLHWSLMWSCVLNTVSDQTVLVQEVVLVLEKSFCSKRPSWTSGFVGCPGFGVGPGPGGDPSSGGKP